MPPEVHAYIVTDPRKGQDRLETLRGGAHVFSSLRHQRLFVEYWPIYAYPITPHDGDFVPDTQLLARVLVAGIQGGACGFVLLHPVSREFVSRAQLTGVQIDGGSALAYYEPTPERIETLLKLRDELLTYEECVIGLSGEAFEASEKPPYDYDFALLQASRVICFAATHDGLRKLLCRVTVDIDDRLKAFLGA
jgi:hypothetical protein